MEIKEIIKLLGKVSITTDGEWNKCRRYDRLCLVYSDYQSYLSKKRVPAGIELDNETYWQPIAALKDVIKEEYKGFKLDILNTLEAVNNKFKSSRLTVETFNDFLELRYDDVRAGAKVYVIEEDIEYIIDSIDRFGTAKTYHDLKDSIISEIDNTDIGRMPNIVAERAINDEDGNNIKDTYVTKKYLDAYFFGDGTTLNKQQIE